MAPSKSDDVVYEYYEYAAESPTTGDFVRVGTSKAAALQWLSRSRASDAYRLMRRPVGPWALVSSETEGDDV